MTPPLKLSQLLQNIEDFYRGARQAYSRIKLAAESYVMPDDEETADQPVPTNTAGILQSAEDLSYNIDNENLLNQFDGLLNSYKGFLNSLQVKSSDYAKEPEQAAEDADNLTSDYIDTINTRWQRLSNNPYLQLSADNDQYTESFPPQRVLDLSQAIVNDVNNKLEAEAAQVESTPEEIIQAQKAADEYNQTQIDKRDPNLRVSGNKIKQLMEAIKRYREKRKFISKVGPNHPEWDKIERFRGAAKSRYHAIMADDNRRDLYVTRAKKRGVRRHQRDKNFELLIDKIKKTTDPNQKRFLENQLVQLEKSKLEHRGFNLDDPFIFNNPEIQDKLDPAKIMARQEARLDRYKARNVRDWQATKKIRETGNLAGLIYFYQQQIANYKSDIAKTIKKNLKRSSIMDPFIKAVNEAKALGNPSAIEMAERREKEFVANHLANHPAVKTIVENMSPQLYAFRDKCNEVERSGILNRDDISPTIREGLGRLIGEGKLLIDTYGEMARAPMEAAQKIVNFLENKLR